MGGRTSDVHIVQQSGFYDILEPHDEVMADRGFTIAEDLILHKGTTSYSSRKTRN